MLARLLLLSLSCAVFSLAATAGRFGPPGPLIFVFAAGASIVDVASLQEVLARSFTTAAVAALAWGLCMLTERFRSPAAPDAQPDPLPPLGHRLFAAARIALAAAIATAATWAAGADHPSWAALGTLAVLQGTHLHITMNRSLQRMLGTLLGAGIVWLILRQEPGIWTSILLIAALQVLTEVIIGMNYALGQIFVTPMALLMTYLASDGASGAPMAAERVADTLVGAVIGLALAVLFSRHDDRVHLARHHEQRQE